MRAVAAITGLMALAVMMIACATMGRHYEDDVYYYARFLTLAEAWVAYAEGWKMCNIEEAKQWREWLALRSKRLVDESKEGNFRTKFINVRSSLWVWISEQQKIQKKLYEESNPELWQSKQRKFAHLYTMLSVWQ